MHDGCSPAKKRFTKSPSRQAMATDTQAVDVFGLLRGRQHVVFNIRVDRPFSLAVFFMRDTSSHQFRCFFRPLAAGCRTEFDTAILPSSAAMVTSQITSLRVNTRHA
jgi:hypothetical protein